MIKKSALVLLVTSAFLIAGCSAGSITASRYVLSYGISDYPASSAHLSSPAIDAQSISDLLVSDGYASRSLRVNSDATKDNIRSDILSLSSLEDDAIVVIFYSSHGTYNMYNDVAYLVPYDAIDDVTGEITAATAQYLISPQELNDWIAQSGQRNVIVIINTCYSGGFVDPESSIDTAPQNYGPYDDGTTPASGVFSALGHFGELLSKNARESGKPGPIVISASGAHESSYEYSDPFYEGHGLFPFFILKSADSGDKNGDGFVTATEAYEYAVAGIKSKWNSLALLYVDPEVDSNQNYILVYADFMPHISGGARDLVLFQK
jgi:hypothetical protein